MNDKLVLNTSLWLKIQKAAAAAMPYGFLLFIFCMFVASTSKFTINSFYALVLIPMILSMPMLLKNKMNLSALIPIILLILFWTVFSFVGDGSIDWDNVIKRFKRAIYVSSFLFATYYVLSIGSISVEKLIKFVFCLTLVYSAFSFGYVYGVEGHPLGTRLYPQLKLYSPIFISIILAAYGIAWIAWSIKNNKLTTALLLLVGIIFFLYFYNSRSAVVSFCVGIGLVSFSMNKARQKWLYLIVLILVVIALCINYFYGNLLSRGGSYRLEIWLATLSKISDCGYLLGCGFNGDSKIIIESGRAFTHPHNILLAHFMKTGLFGLITLSGLIGYVIYQGFRCQSKALIVFVASCVGLIFDGNTLIVKPDAIWLIFWLPMIVTYWEIVTRKSKISF